MFLLDSKVFNKFKFNVFIIYGEILFLDEYLKLGKMYGNRIKCLDL